MATYPVDAQGNARPDARAQLAGLIFAVILIDGEGLIAEVNHAAENLLGTSASRLIGTRLTDRIGPLDPRVEARLLASEEALVARDLLIRVGEHDTRINLTASPLGGFPGWRVVTLSQIGHDEAAGTVGGEGPRGGRHQGEHRRTVARARPGARWTGRLDPRGPLGAPLRRALPRAPCVGRGWHPQGRG